MFKPNISVSRDTKSTQPFYVGYDGPIAFKKMPLEKQTNRIGEKERSNFPHALKKNKLHSLIVRLRNDGDNGANPFDVNKSNNSSSTPTSPVIGDEVDKELQFILRKRSATEGKKVEVSKNKEKDETKNQYFVVNGSINPVESSGKYPHNKNIEISTVKDDLGNNVINIKVEAVPLNKSCYKGLVTSKSERDFSKENLQIPNIFFEKNNSIRNQVKDVTEKIIFEFLENRVNNQISMSDSCAEISNSLRDRLQKMTKDCKKVVVTTYIATRILNSQANESLNVSVKCQKIFGRDECLTVAFENDSYLIWVTLLMAIC